MSLIFSSPLILPSLALCSPRPFGCKLHPSYFTCIFTCGSSGSYQIGSVSYYPLFQWSDNLVSPTHFPSPAISWVLKRMTGKAFLTYSQYACEDQICENPWSSIKFETKALNYIFLFYFFAISVVYRHKLDVRQFCSLRSRAAGGIFHRLRREGHLPGCGTSREDLELCQFLWVQHADGADGWVWERISDASIGSRLALRKNEPRTGVESSTKLEVVVSSTLNTVWWSWCSSVLGFDSCRSCQL